MTSDRPWGGIIGHVRGVSVKFADTAAAKTAAWVKLYQLAAVFDDGVNTYRPQSFTQPLHSFRLVDPN